MIKLSSVIPDRSQIISKRINWNNKEHGYRLYVVQSESIGKGEVSSGIGWIQASSGKGLFSEEAGKTYEEVKRLINLSLNSMRKYRKDRYGKINPLAYQRD